MSEIAITRRKSRQVQIGPLAMGGEAPIVIQSMLNSKTTDVEGSLLQIGRLAEAGCQLVRLAIPNANALPAFEEIKKRSPLPLVADIHFDYRLALGAMDGGADKIRINPGNIGARDKVRQVVEKAVACRIPIRIGVNSGSVEKEILQQEGGPTVRALVRSAMRNVDLCREFGAEDLVLSLKSSDVLRTIAAYQLAAEECDLPLHIGVTEAGTVKSGTIKSAVALGILLHQGIGDTLRVSLTGDVIEEVIAARHILKSLNLVEQGITLISCPTCGRTQVDLVNIAERVEAGLAHIRIPLTVAVMGCVVNGPGEAREADIGVACGRGSAVLIKRGQIVRKIAEDEIVQTLIDEVNNWPAE
ncbi:MAG TPA: flavodoxin-dependent (E)-4-hydroxy-3-methylbut-2-enyl-diphosphate synthase [bacterium]|nr:flavodoxin-dependent (E)-4-hydroxy-3-methylbut-2-enyl-diphosphate synthase [bacterium]HPM58311.1 flavodoxin-dependent (E)-4-hydroxy-3-methylbut-2-enyl-diphosphate synthase [bacterium]